MPCVVCRTLRFVSLEKHPFDSADLARAHAAWPDFANLSEELLRRWPALVAGEHRLELDGGRVELVLVFGDAVDTLPRLGVAIDAFFDRRFLSRRFFAGEESRTVVAGNLPFIGKAGATLATWSVAGHVRRALRGAGFDVEKRPGFGGKWQMLFGRYP